MRVFRNGARPLSRPVRFNRTAVPTGDGDFSFTAEVVVDEPRQPQMFQTGVLAPDGSPIIRVVTPIMLDKIGFDFSHLPAYAAALDRLDQSDEVMGYTTEAQLCVVEDCPGEGLAYVTPEDLEA